METNPLVKELTSYGLTTHEAKVCISLIQEEKLSARKIANIAGIARPDVYRVLRNLQEKNIVVEHMGRPRIYETLHPDDLLESLTVKHEAHAKNLREKQSDISKKLISLRGTKTFTDSAEFFQLIQGVPNIIAKYRDLIEITENELLTLVDRQALALGREFELLEMVETVVQRGIKAKLLTIIDEGNLDHIKELLEYYEIRHIHHIPFLMNIYDCRFLMIGATMPFIQSYKDKTNIFTNKKEFVTLTHANFNEMWEHAAEAENQIRKIEQQKN